MYSVYFALNMTNGKAYAGMTARTAKQRFDRHVYDAGRADRRYRFYFHKALKKYDPSVWSLMTVWTGETKEEAQQVEKNLISGMKLTDSRYGYNLTHGGEGAWGVKRSPETIERMRLAQKGHKQPKWSEETRQKMMAAKRHLKNPSKFPAGHSTWNKGLKLSDEYRQRLSDAHKGHVMPDEQKEKIRLSVKENQECNEGR